MLNKTEVKQRENHLGSSDMAAVLKLDPFRNPYDVYAEKTGMLATRGGETRDTKRGGYLEGAILDYAEDTIGRLVRPNKRNHYLFFVSPVNGIIASHVDALRFSGRYPVEAKSRHLFSREKWGKPGTDELPDRVIIQCQVHMVCTGKKHCYVPAYIGDGREFQLYIVNYNDVLANVILDAAKKFWKNHVAKRIPPGDCFMSERVYKRVKRLDGKRIVLRDKIVRDYQKATMEAIEADKAKKKAKAKLVTAMGNAEMGEFKGGLVTYKNQHKARHVVEESEYRVLRIGRDKAKKKKKVEKKPKHKKTAKRAKKVKRVVKRKSKPKKTNRRKKEKK